MAQPTLLVPNAGRFLASTTWTFGLRLSLLVVTAVAFANPVAARRTDEPLSLTVHVCNYTQTGSSDLAVAEREASGILRMAGLLVFWTECWRAPESSDFSLRILPTLHKGLKEDAIGFALPPVLANVYPDYALRLADGQRALHSEPIILGCVIAHELGHLLLGPESHSRLGIMNAHWGPAQIRQALMGNLRFTSDQSKAIRAALQRQTKQQEVAKLSGQNKATEVQGTRP